MGRETILGWPIQLEKVRKETSFKLQRKGEGAERTKGKAYDEMQFMSSWKAQAILSDQISGIGNGFPLD